MHWFSQKKLTDPSITALILPGGGARNAYQAGVLKAIAAMLPDDAKNPFPVICGTSSGALNAALMASSARDFKDGVNRLTGIWESFHLERVFRTDVWTALKSGTSWAFAFATGGLNTGGPQSVLDNTPLREMLERHLRLARIQQAIDSGALRAIAVTVSSYSSGTSIAYYQGIKELLPWERTRRRGVAEELTIDHLMASTALPVVFPAVRLHSEYHGDGSMREHAPLSPALHLGANRLLIIGVRNDKPDAPPAENVSAPYPTLGQITGYIFDTLFMDSLDSDIERLNRINHTIGETPDKRVEFADTALRPIEFLVISPSRDVRELVDKHIASFPHSVKFLLKGIGALTREGRPLISYLLFEEGFCKELMALGYEDAMGLREEILTLLQPSESAEAVRQTP
jgi:NTE family protein